MSETFLQQACPSAEKEWPICCAVDCFTLEQRSERFTLYSKKIRLSQVWGSSSLITSHSGTCHPGLFRSFCGTDAQETATNADVLTSAAAALTNTILCLLPMSLVSPTSTHNMEQSNLLTLSLAEKHLWLGHP